MRVSRGGAARGQLAERPCPWLLGFPPAPSTHSSTLSLALINVHTCWCICGHMHTQRHTRTDTCANTHAEGDKPRVISAAAAVHNQPAAACWCHVTHSYTHVHMSTYPWQQLLALHIHVHMKEYGMIVLSHKTQYFFVLHNLHGSRGAAQISGWRSPCPVLLKSSSLQVPSSQKKKECIYF